MSLIPTVFRSTDPGAPVLNGQAGSLLALLHAVLVTGYGAGETFKAGAGWTRPFSSPTVHVYRNSTANGSGAFLRIRDDASAAMLNSGSLAQAFAYSSMTDIDTGANQTPSVEMQERGSLIAKAPPSTTGARDWIVIATEIGFYLFTNWSVYNRGRGSYYYGDILSSVSGDPYPFTMFGSGDITGFSGSWADRVMSLFTAAELSEALPTGTGGDAAKVGYPGGFTMRSYSGGAGAPGRVGTIGFGSAASGRYSYGSDIYPAVDRAHGGLNFIRALIKEAPFAIRGQLPGLLAPLHLRPYADGAIVPFIEGFGQGQWLAVNYNTAEPDVAARDGQVLFRLDAPWK